MMIAAHLINLINFASYFGYLSDQVPLCSD